LEIVLSKIEVTIDIGAGIFISLFEITAIYPYHENMTFTVAPKEGAVPKSCIITKNGLKLPAYRSSEIINTRWKNALLGENSG
jgi:hypothetical protein